MVTAPISLAEAQQRIIKQLRQDPGLQPTRLGTERVDLIQAFGRVLATDLASPVDVPAFAASAMDGYAVRSSDSVFQNTAPHVLPVVGESRAGGGKPAPLPENSAMRIFTGAPLPPGADSVLIQENVEALSPDVDSAGQPRIRTQERTQPGQHRRPAGHDVRAGESLFSAGTRLNGFALGQLRACGITTVDVYRLLRVGVFATGDELREPEATLAFGQIVETNRFTLHSLLRPLPVEVVDLGILPDDPDLLRQHMRQAAETCDVLLTSGGVSVGDADHVKPVLEEIGELSFWKIAMKPGKPVAFGRIDDTLFFGLPGNPVSTLVTCLLLVKPALYQLAGTEPPQALRVPATAMHAFTHNPGRVEFQRGWYAAAELGLQVRNTGDQSSNRLRSFHQANCLIEVPADQARIEAGEQVWILPFHGLLDA